MQNLLSITYWSTVDLGFDPGQDTDPGALTLNTGSYCFFSRSVPPTTVLGVRLLFTRFVEELNPNTHRQGDGHSVSHIKIIPKQKVRH